MLTSLFYFPNYDERPGEGCITFFGHHSTQDGTSAMQVLFGITDNCSKETYPFMKRSEPGFLAWCVMYLLTPIYTVFMLKHFHSRPPDINCMKKHSVHGTGEVKAISSKEISVNKLKALCK
jgi:hypothetical protein